MVRDLQFQGDLWLEFQQLPGRELAKMTEHHGERLVY